MANEISITAARPQAPAEMAAEFQKLSGDATKTKEIVGKALEILAGANIRVTRPDATGTDGVAERKTNGATSTPALDNPADPKQVEADLAKLIAYLQLDNEKRQTSMAKDRIEMQKDRLAAEQNDRMREINKSIDKMNEAERSKKANRAFGWLGAIFAVVSAVIVTLATGFAGSAFAIAGAALAVGSLIMNETGAMEKLTQKFAEHMEKVHGMKPEKAQLFAGLVLNLSIMALQLGCGIGAIASSVGGAAVTVSSTLRKVQLAATIFSAAVTAGGMAAGGANTGLGFKAQMAQVDVKQLEKFMVHLQQMLDESEEELQKLLEMLQGALGNIAAIITSATDTSAEIANKIGAMA